MAAPPQKRRKLDGDGPLPEASSALFVGQRVAASDPSDSDHNAILFTLVGPAGPDSCVRETRALSWNITCQYGFNAVYNFPFDGFNRRSEGSDEYLARLERTAAEAERLVDAHSPDVVLLQECAQPGEYADGVMDEKIQERLGRLGFTVLRHMEFVSAVRGTAKTLELPRLLRQEGKIHAVHATQLNVVFLSVHLQWDHKDSEDKEKTCSALKTAVAHVLDCCPRAQIFLIGDTNRVPGDAPRTDPGAATIEELAAGFGTIVYPPGPTNVRWSGEEKGSEMTYADFAISIPGS